MSTWLLILACSAGAVVALGVTLYAATWPVREEPGVHRRGPDRNPAHPANPAPEPESDPVPLEPTAESWMWDAGAWPRSRPRHRWEHLEEHTQRIQPPKRPGGPPPEWPPWPPVE